MHVRTVNQIEQSKTQKSKIFVFVFFIDFILNKYNLFKNENVEYNLIP